MIVGQRPVFGFGLRTFHLIFPLQQELPDQKVGSWHNDFLQIYMESGLVGLLAFVALIVAVGVVAYRGFRTKPVPELYRRTTAALVLSLFIVFIVGGFLDTHVGMLMKLMLALLGLISVSGEGVQGASVVKRGG